MIKLTEAARAKIISILDENGSSMLRFGVQGGGCSGFVYSFSLEDKMEDDDLEFPLDETHKVIVDCMSEMYVGEAELDYKKELSGESFVIKNPNVKTSCGCGNSFSVD